MILIDRIKTMWSAMYDPKQDPVSVIEAYFHPKYEQCINGVTMSRSEYIDHVIAQKNSMTITHIDYSHHPTSTKKCLEFFVSKEMVF